ncbi:helix-turn-helix transcriptional regulator [Sungkyunkwania multivorans]|uniref:Helix-turn-helix transcriptional regulator n=1 Tax=Sungkyunkwania multivorans TaxID=1173618 RepID=A0ABW3CYK1_9FLAO
MKALKQRLESKHDGTISKIKTAYPNLTSNDVKHCILIKLNLSVKETAQSLNVSTHAVKMARKRVKKKIGLADSDSLKNHVSTIT